MLGKIQDGTDYYEKKNKQKEIETCETNPPRFKRHNLWNHAKFMRP